MSERKPERLWASRDKSGMPAVPYRILVVEEQIGFHGEMLVRTTTESGDGYGTPFRIHSTWTHEFFDDARKDAVEAIHQLRWYFHNLEGVLFMTPDPDHA